MSNALAVSVTDELVAELEALASECGQHGTNWYEPRHMVVFPEYACDQDFVVAASPATILALLEERAELKRDAKRYRFWRYMATHEPAKMARILSFYENQDQLDTAIDAAMQS